jgi:hypothetical protein
MKEETYFIQLSAKARKALEAECILSGKSPDRVASEIILKGVSTKAKEMAEMLQPPDASNQEEAERMKEQSQFHHGSSGYR